MSSVFKNTENGRLYKLYETRKYIIEAEDYYTRETHILKPYAKVWNMDKFVKVGEE